MVLHRIKLFEGRERILPLEENANGNEQGHRVLRESQKEKLMQTMTLREEGKLCQEEARHSRRGGKCVR